MTERHFEPASPARPSSKRSKHDGIISIEDGVSGSDCEPIDQTSSGRSAEYNKQRDVTRELVPGCTHG